MTLMDEPCADREPQDQLLSHPAGGDHPAVSVVVPVHPLSDAASTLERLPHLEGQVILVAPPVPHTDLSDREVLRVGFGAARGDCIVVLSRAAEVGAGDVERFVSTLRTGCRSAQRSAA
jgi:hypothetical protein